MRSSFAPRGGPQLLKTPSHRQEVARRRFMVAGALLGLALASGLIGSLTAGAPEAAPSAPQTGPFSYLSE